MKKILSLLLILVSAKSFCQGPSTSEQKLIFGKIDSIVTSYINYSSFVTPGKNGVTPDAVNNFKGLFAPGIQVPHEMIPAYFYGDTTRPDSIVMRSVNDYSAGILTYFKAGITVQLLYSDINLSSIADKAIKVLMIKKQEGYMPDGLNLQNQDTVVLSLKISDDYSRIVISNVEVLGYKFSSNNDKDGDFIKDDNDPCPDKANVNRQSSTGKSNGCITDWQLAKIAAYLKDSAAAGKAVAEKSRDVKECNDKQTSIDNRISTLNDLLTSAPHFWIGGGVNGGMVNSSLKNGPDLTTTFKGSSAFGGDIHLSYFFGKTASFGISAGAAYSTFSGNLTEDVYNRSFSADDPRHTDAAGHPTKYTQIISLTKGPVVESVSLSQLSIPVTLIYKGKFSDKFGYMLEGGVAYNLQYSGTMSSTDASFIYEAVYNYDKLPKKQPGTNDNNPAGQAFRITRDMATNVYKMDLQTYLTTMSSGYPVGYDVKTFNSTNSSATFDNGSLSFLMRMGLTYNPSPVFSVSATVFFQSSTFNNTSAAAQDYKLINDATSRNYNTLLNGVSSMSNTLVGLRIGIAHTLFYNTDKWKTEQEQLRKNLTETQAQCRGLSKDLMDEQNRLNEVKKHKPVF